MKIKKITWFSKEALEADVIVGDGKFEITTFCQPCEFTLGEELTERAEEAPGFIHGDGISAYTAFV